MSVDHSIAFSLHKLAELMLCAHAQLQPSTIQPGLEFSQFSLQLCLEDPGSNAERSESAAGQLMTNHTPLQWLSSQKMEGLLCQWTLGFQEYDFDIKGSFNSNADGREYKEGKKACVATTLPTQSPAALHSAQQ